MRLAHPFGGGMIQPVERMNNKAALKYITALLLFGSNGIVASRIPLSSPEIVFTRTLIGSLFLVIVFVGSRQRARATRNRRHFLYLAISGVAMGTSWVFLFEAYNQIGVSLATLAYYCGPVIVMALSPLVFRERLTAARLLGFAAVVAGMLIVNRDTLLQGQVSWGLVFGLMAALTYSFMVIFNKMAGDITGLENPMWQLIISFVTVAIFLGLRQGYAIPITRGSLAPVLFLGVVNTGIGCYFYFSSIGDLPVQTVSILGYLEPLSALFFSALLLGETLSLWQWVGAALILGGAAFGEMRGMGERGGEIYL